MLPHRGRRSGDSGGLRRTRHESVPLAADRLLEDIMRRLRAIKPDVLIEFRQSYVGPAPRKYGNIFRVGDCPCDIFSNRAHSIDLRLSSGATAVHSDMLIWDSPETSENAAAQLLASLFATLQISVRLAEIPEGHKRVLRFWLDFMKTHKDTLQKSPLQAKHPEANYPLVRANGKSEEIVASYCADCLVELEGLPGRTYYVVNASGEEELPLELGATPKSVARLSAEGVEIAGAKPEKGARRIDVPVSGMLVLKY
jgi:alpha-galactosidase